MKRLATVLVLMTCALLVEHTAYAQEVIPVESVKPINLEVPKQPATTRIAAAPMKHPTVPSLWVPGGILLSGVVMIAAGTTMMLLADFSDGLWVGGVSLVSIGAIAVIISAFVGTAFSARRKVIKQYFEARRATFSANGFSIKF